MFYPRHMKRLFFGRTQSARLQFFRYLFVGGSSAVLHIMIFTILLEAMQMHYLLANFFAFIGGVSWNYGFGILWVFTSKHRRRVECGMVFAISFLGLLWNQLLLYLFVEYAHMQPLLANIIAIWIVLFWNFGMRKKFVFH